MADVRLIDVAKSYDGKTKVVSNVSIEIQDKEFVVLVGPSGCGKSTTLRMIAGLESITEGNIFIGDTLVNDTPPKDRDIAMVFQNYALYPHMTVFDNMAFGLKLRKFPKDEIKERVEHAADILDITQYLTRKPKALSGGQRQRVAVGRALVRNPKVFLFDEPLSNLDAKLRVQMRTEISKLHHKLGATMIYVTHDQTEAMTMGDRIVVMKDGFIQQIDTPLNLYNNPKNKFVAGFIGSPPMNFINGKVTIEPECTFHSLSNELTFKAPKQYKKIFEKYNDKELILGIRPEDIHLKQKDTSDAVAYRSVLEVVEPMGNEIFIYFKIDKTQMTGRVTPDTNVRAGMPIAIMFDETKLKYFDSSTGERILD